MDFPGLIGPYYQPFSEKAESQTCRNLYLELIESGQGRNQFAMYRSHGLKVIKTKADPTKLVNRGFIELNDHLFRVQDDTVYDMLSDGSLNNTYGPIGNDGLLCSLAFTTNSLFVVSNGTFYRMNGGVTTTPAAVTVPKAAAVAVIDGIVVLLAQNTNQFFYSVDDGQTWPALAFQTAEAYPNTLLNMVVDHQELWLFGNRRIQVFVVGTDPNNPFEAVSSGVIEMGLGAMHAVVQLDNSMFWLGRNKDGDHIISRANGYTPVRVSNHAIENAIRGYATHEDMIMQTYQLNGHSCLRLTSPSAHNGLGETWEYDVSTGNWYQIGFYNMATGLYERHRANGIVSAFQNIYVGDYANGFMYQMSPDFNTDFGFPIRWERRAPHQSSDGKRIAYKRFGVFMQVGVGSTTPVWLNDHSIQRVTFLGNLATLVGNATITQAQSDVMLAIYDYRPYDQDLVLPDLSTLALGFFDYGADPQVGLRWSNDGGFTFNDPQYRSMGRIGSYYTRIFWTRLGMSRDRVWEISGNAPVKTAIVQAAFDGSVCLS